MFKTVLASAWISATLVALVMGLNGSIDPAAMVTFSLIALALFYAFALRTVIVNTREPQTQSKR